MATFKEISAADIKTSRSSLNQLVDVVQEDISGSTTRRKYEVFVTGGVGPGVTSSLFQTVYDQDFSLQTANPIFDMTVGLYSSGSTALTASSGQDSSGKLLFPSNSLMMREKIDIYKQYSQTLLGNSDNAFYAPFGSATTSNRIDNAFFMSYRRLFARDKIKRETFAMRFYQSASLGETNHDTNGHNIGETSISGSAIFTDIGAAANKRSTFGGEVGDLVDSANTSRKVGLIFYDHGTVVLDLAKVISGSQHISGSVSGMSAGSFQGAGPGNVIIGGIKGDDPNATFIPGLMVSGSVDNILDHLASTRFQSGTLTGMTFQNQTHINSTLVFCRATADEFNYSSNPTYTDSDNKIRVIDDGQEDTQRGFAFPTTVGLYDANDNLLAVAKMSRPIEKNDEKDITIRVRLDF